MPLRQSAPRIRIDLPDSSSHGISPSSTLDIKDALGRAKLLPKLLAEDLAFDVADDTALYFEDGHFPCFPRCRPPLFILNSHRSWLPFPIRPDAFELGGFCRDEEDVCPLLTAPTIPRMKMVVKEQLYVQKWIDNLTPESPPKHTPWTCEIPSTIRNWIAEGSIFPAIVVKPDKFSIQVRQGGAIEEHSRITITSMSAISDSDQVPYSGELCAYSEVSVPMSASTESHTLQQHVHTKSADDNRGILYGDSKTSHCVSRASQVPSRSILLPCVPQKETVSTSPDVPLAICRGKSPSHLKLPVDKTVIEHLEYPDIPTAFRGSPAVWSPSLDTFPVQSLTDHDNMLLNLKLKCAVLGRVSAYFQEPRRPQLELARTSLNVDEWAFTLGLAIDSSFLGSTTDSLAPKEIVADTSTFLPDDSSTPAKGVTASLGFPSTPPAHSPRNRSGDPPAVPLPPRPALINPSTPSHVRGILKKVKNVRFEDVTTKGTENCTLSAAASRTAAEPRLPLPLVVSPKRPCTPMPEMENSKSATGPHPVKEASGKNTQKKSVTRSRLPPKRAKANEKPGAVQVKMGNAPEPSKPTLVTIPVERPCRSTHVKENNNPTVAASWAHTRQKGLTATETDIRRGIEGAAKSRLSTPLRNMFRFR